jgi:hypothetical protein
MLNILRNQARYVTQKVLLKSGLYKPEKVWYSYSERDHEIVDYNAYQIPELPYTFRGPKPRLNSGEYIAFLGAAQTFGCFCPKPFPEIIKHNLDVDILNLGMGGAGPDHFNQPKLITLVNDSKVAVLQVLSARSVENSFMKDCTGTITIRETGEKVSGKEAYRILLNQSEDYARKIVSETRKNYLSIYKNLLSEIKVPVILFWFSKRKPEYEDDYSNFNKLLNDFPHLVNQELLEEIIAECDDYVECISDRGSPQKLLSRFTGKPASVIDGPGKKPKRFNYYYPSPEMHEDAANKLQNVLSKFLN